MKKTSFFHYTYNKYFEIINEHNHKPDLKEQQKFFLENLKCFPNFPDVDLISELSYENYERKACNVNLVFLPFETLYIKNKDDSLTFLYTNKMMTFEKKHIRLIRKISESSDKKHALVLCYNERGIYCFDGIIALSEIDKTFSDYYFISIIGYSHWSVRCKNFNLFDFKNGNFCDCNKKSNDFKEQMQDIINIFKSCNFEIDLKTLQKILKVINKQNHGTSFVVFKDAQKAHDEVRRLCDAQRGFEAKKPLTSREFVKCIPQFTKVDGGLLLDSKLNCYAYGCIFDGVVPENFKGSLANGSRFNSTALYTYNINYPLAVNKQTDEEKHLDEESKLPICLGVVFSDDGGVKIAQI